MAMATTSTIPPAVQFYYDKTLLKKLRPLLTYNKWGQVKTQPKGYGVEMKFRRYNDFAVNITPLSEGITPAPVDITYSDVTATLSQYGMWVPVSDVVQLTSPDAVLTEFTELFGQNQAKLLDTILRNQLLSGTNIQYAASVANRTSITQKLSAEDFRKIVRTLKGANVPQITSMVKPTTGIGTTPIPPSYICITHPDAEADLRALESSGFVPVEKYPSQSQVSEGELGAGWGIRFIATTQCSCLLGAGDTPATGVKGTGSKVDVYQSVIFGGDAFGRIDMTNGNSGVIVKNDGGTSDPLNQRVTIGYKCWYTGKILEDARIVRYEHGVSA